MCQDNNEDKSGRDIYVSRQHWRKIREGYMCQDNIEDKSGRDIRFYKYISHVTVNVGKNWQLIK